MVLQLHSCSEVQKTDRSHKRRKVSTNPGDLCGIQVKIFLEMTRAGKKCPDLKEVVCNLVPIGRHVTLSRRMPWFWMKAPQNSPNLAADVVALWKLSGPGCYFPTRLLCLCDSC